MRTDGLARKPTGEGVLILFIIGLDLRCMGTKSSSTKFLPGAQCFKETDLYLQQTYHS
jgi:hypothetical protein